VDDWDAAAHRRLKPELALGAEHLLCVGLGELLLKLGQRRRDERLVGRHHVFAVRDRAHHHLLGQRRASHHLAHEIDAAVAEDLLHVVDDSAAGREREVAWLRLVAHADRRDLHVHPKRRLQLARALEDGDDAAADSAATDEADTELPRRLGHARAAGAARAACPRRRAAHQQGVREASNQCDHRFELTW